MAEWTVDPVAERFAESADRARRLPSVRLQGCYFNLWQAIRRQPWETWGASDIEPRPLLPPPAAIERLLETMGWVCGSRSKNGMPGCGPGHRVEGDRPALRVRPDHGVAAVAEGASDRSRRSQHGNVAKVCQNTYYHAMSSMNISLPDSLKAFVDEQVAQRGYGTGSEYVRELIRKDRDRMRLRELLLEGAATQPGGPADEAYFESLRDRVRKRAQG